MEEEEWEKLISGCYGKFHRSKVFWGAAEQWHDWS